MSLELTEIGDDLGHYFSIAEFRATDTSYSDTTKYPTATLGEIRDGVEDDFEAEGNCAFVTRGATETLSGDAGTLLFLSNPMVQSVTSVTIDGTALTETELADVRIDDRILYRERGWAEGYQNIEVAYSHGYESVPQAIKEKALQVARWRLSPSKLPANATSQVVDGASYRIALTSDHNPFGDPDVIVTIRRYGRSPAQVH